MALLAVLPCAALGADEKAPAARFGSLVAGSSLPQFEVVGPEGQPFKSEEFKGAIAVINFTATNRPAAAPLESAFAQYQDLGVKVISICTGATREDFESWARRNRTGVTYPLTWDSAGANREQSVAASRFGLQTLPATAVFDRDGKLVGGFFGFGATASGVLRDFLRTAGAAIPDPKPAAAALEPEAPAPLAKGALAPDFSLPGLDGQPVKLSDSAGKVIILAFWSTRSAPSVAELPALQSIAATHKAKGVVVLAVCTGDERRAFERWLETKRDSLPDLTFATDERPATTPGSRKDERVSRQIYGVDRLPTRFVIARDGRIADVIAGHGAGDDRLQRAVARLLE